MKPGQIAPVMKLSGVWGTCCFQCHRSHYNFIAQNSQKASIPPIEMSKEIDMRV